MNKPQLAVVNPNSPVPLDEQIATLRQRAEAALEDCLPGIEEPPAILHEAMRYATLGAGKRMRALLVYGAGMVVSADWAALDRAACAVELIHAYSLIHDDLPCMDDDELRRGKPTCHIAYGEATAILTGDALQALAFAILSDRASAPGRDAQLRQVETLAAASGSRGMAGGQMLDLLATNEDADIDSLSGLHSLKTGQLIRASVRLGALCGKQVGEEQLDVLDKYAESIGLAFQIIDDILDEESDTETLGKTSGADRDMGKSTYPSLLGINGSRQAAMELYQQAIASLRPLGDNTVMLKGLAEKIVTRIS